ncbi:MULTISPECIES: lysis system i-spanin subunit Rz [Pseudomonas]|uniref:Bacteriophage lysis protein n=2 Tax=Pseudomonas TaxID=286 RepID=A0A120G4U9_PSEFL|nr:MULTISPECIES: lysis system i-spanin subunit Rz [Pseudomonas]KWV83109.1 Bacteriophage lysis protein [Pseudomonas fluorescens]MDD1942312.1 lysis protein [Pseudomonas carnis]
MREGTFILVVCLVAWFGFDLLQGQRDTARSERDAALFEASGLREAARISGEMLAERDAIDLQRTQELNHERAENDALRLDVAAGRKRLRVTATCSASMSTSAGASGVADAAAAELTADARPDYFTLVDQLALSKKMILGLQDHALRVCPRQTQPTLNP